MPQANKKIVLWFDFEQETKNTVRFKERTAEPTDKGIMGKIYVQKETLEGWGSPRAITVTVEAGHGR